MSIRDPGEAKRVLGPHLPAFHEIVLDGIRMFYDQFGPAIHALEMWTQRSIVRDLIKERMIQYCEDQPGLDFVRKGNATYFGAANKFIWKVKKLNDDLLTNTPSTQSSFNFHINEGVQGELLDSPDATCIYLGYVPTENDPLNPPIYLVCNDSEGIAWALRLEPPAPPPTSTIDPPAPAAPGDAPSRVKVRASRKPASNG